MRRRLFALVVGLTLVLVALYPVLRASVHTDVLAATQQERLDRSADLIALLVAQPSSAGAGTAVLTEAVVPGVQATWTTARGDTVRVGTVTGDAGQRVTARRDLPGGGTLVLQTERQSAAQGLRESPTMLLLAGLALVLIALVVALVVARRLSRPFQDLAESARQLGAGHLDAPIPHSSIPEAEAIGVALREGSRQLGAMMAHERQFADSASHQLRTPLTALRLDLEDLCLWKETDPAVAAHLRESLVELKRLSTAVTVLLERSRVHRMEQARRVDLTAVVDEAVHYWQARAAASSAELVHDSTRSLPAHVPLAAVAQTLDALIEDEIAATTDGTAPRRRRITVRTLDLGTHAQIEIVSDPDWGVRPATVAVARAHELASFLGGHLTMGSVERPGTRLLLPTEPATQLG
ncbi:MAG: HAMP domain-containing sensor histidine kinase [Terracoccus sp.]